MKVGVLLGRGVEGVGLTKNVVEFQKLFPGVEVFATIDKLWQRMNSMEFKVNYFSLIYVLCDYLYKGLNFLKENTLCIFFYF